MTDIILSIRLGVRDTKKNKKAIAEFSEWLNSDGYLKCGIEHIEKVLKTAKVFIEGDISTKITNSEHYDYLLPLHHPKLEKSGVWFLDEFKLKNKSEIWIKLENQWVKSKVSIKEKKYYVVIEPENVIIPITENLFLKWL